MKGENFASAILHSSTKASLSEELPPSPSYRDLLVNLAAVRGEVSAEAFFQKLPAGMTLARAYYSRIETTQCRRALSEFHACVRPLFMQFLAETRKRELLAMGVSETGIENMKKGREPLDAQGRRFALSVDHVIERSGSGLMGYQRAVDRSSPDPRERLMVNHFRNLVLLPDCIHKLKNELNDAQGTHALKHGEGKWILMLVPRRRDFLFVPRPHQRHTYPLRTKAEDMHALPVMTPLLIDRAVSALDGVFKQVGRMRGIIADSDRGIRAAFDRAAASKHEADFDNFLSFYQGRRVRKLRSGIQKVFLKEASALRRTFRIIDREIEQRRSSGPQL